MLTSLITWASIALKFDREVVLRKFACLACRKELLPLSYRIAENEAEFHCQYCLVNFVQKESGLVEIARPSCPACWSPLVTMSDGAILQCMKQNCHKSWFFNVNTGSLQEFDIFKDSSVARQIGPKN